MKKLLSLFCLIILAHFLAIDIAYCQEDVFIDTNQTKFQNFKSNFKKKFKSIFETKNDPLNPKVKKAKNVKEGDKEPLGYYGVLPNIEKEFRYKRGVSNKTVDSSKNSINGVYLDDLKPANFDDSLFLDVIVKKEKPSQYINDIQRTKIAITGLKTCIEEKGNIQRFNASVNLIDLYVKNLKNKYQNTSDCYRQSYQNIIALNYYAKVLGNLKYDANYYARYVPVNQGQYSKTNINIEEQKLLNRINKTLFVIGSES